METTTFTINDKDVGTVYFVRNEHKVFVILSELMRCFGYNPLSGKVTSTLSDSSMLKKNIVKFDLRRTGYYDHFSSSVSVHAGRLRGLYSRPKPCVEINNLMAYLKNSKRSASRRKESVRRFLLDNFQSINKQEELPGLFKSASRNTVSDSFDNMSNELSSLKNKFKAMQINLDSQKEQIDAKDKSIFALRAKIKELEEQNADLKSQLEKQSTLNKRFDAFVQSLQSVNNVLHDDLR